MRFFSAEMRGVRIHTPALAALVALATLATLGCGEVNTVKRVRATQMCRPAEGPPPSQCRLHGTSSDWLPPAYLANSVCRCQATPSSPTGNCVRGKLDAAMWETDFETRDAWKQKRVELYDAGRVDEYNAWVEAVAGPEIYRWHQKAQADCCCSAPLPAYPVWVKVLVEPFGACSRAKAFEGFGTCRGQRTRW